MLKRIHVNQLVIRHNKKYGNELPAIRVEELAHPKKVRYCKEVAIHGPSRLVYRPDAPLPCGAKLWIETTADVTTVFEVPYTVVRERMEEIAK